VNYAPQGAKAVAQRCITLNYVIGIAYYAKPQKLHEFLIETGLIEHASAKEQALLAKSNHTEEEKADATWLAESVQGLAWCMGLLELDPFRGCNHNLASRFPKPFVDHSEFVNSATIRSFDDIYEQADLHYQLHWAVRNARLTGSACGVNEWVARKRRKSLDWVIGVEPDWAQLPLDT